MNMTELRKLKLSSVPSASIKELCDALAAIDRISADGYDVSCFEVSAGQTFEESTHTPAPKHRIGMFDVFFLYLFFKSKPPTVCYIQIVHFHHSLHSHDNTDAIDQPQVHNDPSDGNDKH